MQQSLKTPGSSNETNHFHQIIRIKFLKGFGWAFAPLLLLMEFRQKFLLKFS